MFYKRSSGRTLPPSSRRNDRGRANQTQDLRTHGRRQAGHIRLYQTMLNAQLRHGLKTVVRQRSLNEGN